MVPSKKIFGVLWFQAYNINLGAIWFQADKKISMGHMVQNALQMQDLPRTQESKS